MILYKVGLDQLHLPEYLNIRGLYSGGLLLAILFQESDANSPKLAG